MDNKISMQNAIEGQVYQGALDVMNHKMTERDALVAEYRRLKRKMEEAKEADEMRKLQEALSDEEKEQAVMAVVKALTESDDYKKWLDKELAKDKRRKHKKLPADDKKRVALYIQSFKRGAIVIPTATFDKSLNQWEKEGFWRAQGYAHPTGLCVLDLDHVVNAREVAQQILQREDFAALRIFWLFITASGEGIKLVFAGDAALGNCQDNAYEMAEKLGLLQYADGATKDISHAHFIPGMGDVLYADYEKMMNYYDPEFERRYGEAYRRGESAPTQKRWLDYEAQKSAAASADKQGSKEASSQVTHGQELSVQKPRKLITEYHGVSLLKIAEQLVKVMGEPAIGDRHAREMKMGRMLSVICDNDADSLTAVMEQLPFVRQIIDERGEDVAANMRYICSHPSASGITKPLKQALLSLGVILTPEQEAMSLTAVLPINKWADEIEALMEFFPCLKEACHGVRRELWPGVLFTAAAFMGTLMTRCWYRFYADPSEICRLNYAVYIIGDPGAGKRFAKRLYVLLCAPIKESDKVGVDAENNYKQQVKRRGTSSKEQKEAGLSRPEVIVRNNGPRTSNSDFIRHMLNAVEGINGEPWHLHLITFDAELENTIKLSKQGGWICKDIFELKQFHNEEDTQSYANLDSVNGSFEVFWNYVFTGTSLSLRRKVTEGNFGSGLATRLGVIPAPPSNFNMIPLRRQSDDDTKADDTLREWAYRLDQRQGELPLWPLVEHVYHWCEAHMEIAGFNHDRADELLVKRVPYYGINVAAPWIDMRHWEEREQTGTYEIDDIDRRLCSLVLDIQYQCQHFYFGEYARKYFDDQANDPAIERRRTSRFEDCFRRLPEEFTTEQFVNIFGYENQHSAQKTIQRFIDDRVIERTKRGAYKKLIAELS